MKKALSVFLCFLIVFIFKANTFALDTDALENTLNETSKYLYETVKNPNVGSVGGEWAVMGLARSGKYIPKEYYESYYHNVEQYVKEHEGILHDKKYTEYSRVIIALTSIGKNPQDVAGYNLISYLSDYKKTTWQGVNGAIWALIAIDCKNYELPPNSDAEVAATKAMYIDNILDNQKEDGGWSLQGEGFDPDVTAMALSALSKYQDNERVKEATKKALSLISENQNENGGFLSGGEENSESIAQMIVAFCALGITVDDPRFVKNGNTILDNLMTYYEDGAFRHKKDGAVNMMATEQAFYALVALNRFNKNQNSLYSMGDAVLINESNENNGFSGKNPDVRKMNIISPGKSFEDIKGHLNQRAIEKLAERSIISGKTENLFMPGDTMTRAEFATIIVKGLGLSEKYEAKYSDVTENDWFFGFVNAAQFYGIVNGVSDTEFNPGGEITREEAAVMVSKAAKLCGMDTEFEESEIRDILAGFTDYVKASEWAKEALAFCYGSDVLSCDVMEINPKEAVTRGEIAGMIYNMLSLSDLI